MLIQYVVLLHGRAVCVNAFCWKLQDLFVSDFAVLMFY